MDLSFGEEILQWDKDILADLEKQLQPLSFKSSKELQKNLEMLIPPKEVLQATSFLVQDAPNIFEMPPAQRIQIFKEMFGLLDIDVAKEKVADRKREITAKIKALEDTSLLQQRFTAALSSLEAVLREIAELQPDLLPDNVKKFLDEMVLLGENVQIEGFEIGFNQQDLARIKQKIQAKLEEFASLQTQLEQLKAQLQKLLQQKRELEGQKVSAQQMINQLEKQIRQLENLDLQQLYVQKKQLLKKIEELA